MTIQNEDYDQLEKRIAMALAECLAPLTKALEGPDEVAVFLRALTETAIYETYEMSGYEGTILYLSSEMHRLSAKHIEGLHLAHRAEEVAETSEDQD